LQRMFCIYRRECPVLPEMRIYALSFENKELV